jgi:tRNA(fMet)-specific endonuclease VapC
MTYVLDTNTCIYLINHKPAQVIKRLLRHDVSEIALSSITLSELHYGVALSTYRDTNTVALKSFVAPFTVLSYDESAAEVYGELRAALKRHATPIGPMDLLIAAHTLSLNATLVTNNEREFQRIHSLKIENWAA